MDSVIFPIIGALITLVVAILNWATSKRETEKWDKRAYQYVVLLAAAFTAYGTWRGFLLSEENGWRQSDVQFQNVWLQQKHHKERLQYERELRAKSDEIAALSKNIAASVIGGNSFCYLAILSNSPLELITFGILVEGKFPLYEVAARIVDLDEKFPTTLEGFARNNLAIGNLAAGASKLDAQWVIKNPSRSTLKRYNIFFSARNGFFDESIRIARVNDSWVTAIRVRRNGKKIFEQINKIFPRNHRGEVEWTGH